MKGEGGQNAMDCEVVRKEHLSIKDTLKYRDTALMRTVSAVPTT